MTSYDHVVLGAGIVGSWTALHLVRAGKNVLLLEQFNEPHTRGSSHGQSRIIRTCYAEDFFTDMMPHAFSMWNELEKKYHKKLIEKTGALLVSESKENENYQNCVSNMKRASPQNLEELTLEQLKSRFSKQLSYDGFQGFILDKTGGILLAHQALLAVKAAFREEGGVLWEGCQVTSITSKADGVELATSRGGVSASSVVVCAGPWTGKLLTPHLIPSLPLQPTAVWVYYMKEKVKGIYSAASGFPALIDLKDRDAVYSLPSLEYPGLTKVCVHSGVPCDPDERDRVPQDVKREKLLKDYLKSHYPLLETEPAIVEKCMYTMTPDEVFIIDTLPQHKRVAVGAGFSGTGFKTAPTVGKLLMELATGKQPFLDLKHYRLSRFN